MNHKTGLLYKADAAVNGAMEEIRSLIAEAVRDEAFTTLGELGRLADGLRALTLDSGSRERLATPVTPGPFRTSESDSDVNDSARTESTSGRARRRGTSGKGYPKFKKQGDRLVKIGWSKKDASEYEHKAPKSAVEAVVATLIATAGRKFVMDELLPLKDSEDADVPSYQVYLVVAWLRQLDIVARTGNDGYSARIEALSNGRVEKEWQSLFAS